MKLTNRWRCQHCGTCGFGQIVPHDRPEGISCRPSGQMSERAIRVRLNELIEMERALALSRVTKH